MGRNPATGEAIKIKASKKIAFRPAKELKEAVWGRRTERLVDGGSPAISARTVGRWDQGDEAEPIGDLQ